MKFLKDSIWPNFGRWAVGELTEISDVVHIQSKISSWVWQFPSRDHPQARRYDLESYPPGFINFSSTFRGLYHTNTPNINFRCERSPNKSRSVKSCSNRENLASNRVDLGGSGWFQGDVIGDKALYDQWRKRFHGLNHFALRFCVSEINAQWQDSALNDSDQR